MYILNFFNASYEGENFKVLWDDIRDGKLCVFPREKISLCFSQKSGDCRTELRKGRSLNFKEKEPRVWKNFLDGIKTAFNGRYFMHSHGMWYTVNKRQRASEQQCSSECDSGRVKLIRERVVADDPM